MKKIRSRLVAIFICIGVAMSVTPDSNAASMDTGGSTAQSNMLKITPGMTSADLAGRPGSTLVVLSSGKTIKLGRLRHLLELSRKAKLAKASPMPRGLALKPAQTGYPVKSGQDLSAALKRPDSDTLQLPSGRKITVGMLRYLQPLVEQQLGRKISDASPRGGKNAKVIKIKKTADKAYWESILKKPGATVLENPDGKRITVGDLKLALKNSSAGHGGSVSPAAPKKP